MKRVLLGCLVVVLFLGLPAQAIATSDTTFHATLLATGLRSPKGIVSPLFRSGAGQFGQNLYVADSGDNQIVKVPKAGGSFTVFAATGPFSFPVGVGFDGGPFGNFLYVSNASTGGVTRVDPSGVVTPFALSGHFVAGMDFGRADFGTNLYIGEYPKGVIWRVDPTGAATEFASVPGTQTRYMRLSHGGSFGTELYFTDFRSGNVYRVDAAGVASLFSSTGESCLEGLDFSPGGAFGRFLYAGNLCSGNIYRIAPDGTASLWASGLVPGSADIDFEPDAQGGFTMYVVDGRDSVWAISSQ
jgi:hypothetical protein